MLGLITAGASTIRDDRQDADYLDLALRPEYASVGTFVNSWGFSGSGILIAPDWVLTGAHMFAAATSGHFTINGTSYGTSQLIGHPSWNPENEFSGYDFGLAQLSAPVFGVNPATLYGGFSERGHIGTFVGFGLTGTGLTGYQILDNQKRAFQNVIDGDFGTPEVLWGSDFDNPASTADNDFGDPVPLNLEGMVAPGDSGGGVFITFGSSTYLAGVISFVAARDGRANADYGDVAGFGRVSAVLPWINLSIPEPTTGALVSAGFAGLLAGRRRFIKQSQSRAEGRNGWSTVSCL
jgi:hypothetical protein